MSRKCSRSDIVAISSFFCFMGLTPEKFVFVNCDAKHQYMNRCTDVNEKIHEMLNFKEIENRIKKHTGLSEGKDIAALFGMTPQNYSNKKGLGTILPTIIEWAIQENVNLDWLLKGEQIEVVAEKQAAYLSIDRETQIVNQMMEGMTDQQRRDILKYVEDKKLLAELIAERQIKQAA